MPDRPGAGRRWRWDRTRLSVRMAMAMVLVVACGFGHIANRARVRREAVDAIRSAGGVVAYDYQHKGPRVPTDARYPGTRIPWDFGVGGPRVPPDFRPAWRRWLADRIGEDLFAEVIGVHLWRAPIGSAAARAIEDFDRLEVLYLAGPHSNEELDFLEGKTGLKFLLVTCPEISAEGYRRLQALTGLEQLILERTPIDDVGLWRLAKLPSLRVLILSDRSRITDAGLVHFHRHGRIESLGIRGPRMTWAGIASLHGANPSLRSSW